MSSLYQADKDCGYRWQGKWNEPVSVQMFSLLMHLELMDVAGMVITVS